jgi:hypothetical protein
MAKVPDEDLEFLIKNSKITGRAAAKLRATNRKPARATGDIAGFWTRMWNPDPETAPIKP